MNTEKFNTERFKNWLPEFVEKDSRVFMVVGMQKDGSITYVADYAIPIADMINTLEKISESMGGKIKQNDFQEKVINFSTIFEMPWTSTFSGTLKNPYL